MVQRLNPTFVFGTHVTPRRHKRLYSCSHSRRRRADPRHPVQSSAPRGVVNSGNSAKSDVLDCRQAVVLLCCFSDTILRGAVANGVFDGGVIA